MNNDNIKDDPIYPISTAAQLLDISVHTLRMYEKEGLIVPHKKETNQRAYSDKDIHRLQCIRKAINESKISINGIKVIYSLIPCWELTNCPVESRENCDGYMKHEKPCWTYKHKNNICAEINCRDCEVYQNFGECGSIKNVIKQMYRKTK